MPSRFCDLFPPLSAAGRNAPMGCAGHGPWAARRTADGKRRTRGAGRFALLPTTPCRVAGVAFDGRRQQRRRRCLPCAASAGCGRASAGAAHATPFVLQGGLRQACAHCQGSRGNIYRYTALAPQGATLPDIVVDGLLGTGFCGTLRPETLEIIRRVNALPGQPFVLAIDIPSGLDGRTGLAMPEAIRATATVSFAAAKPGLALPLARPWTGELHVRGIGIPLAAQRRAPCSFYAVDGRSLAPLARIQPDGF